jgi:hypothetical protein
MKAAKAQNLAVEQQEKKKKESCTHCLAMPRLEHTYIYPFFLIYFGPLGRMPHFTLFIIFLILIQSDKRGK